MFSPVSNPNSLRLRPPPPSSFHSSPLPSPTSSNLRSPLSASATATADSTCLSPPPSLYEILGISTGATGGEIKSAYRRLARTSHPDVKESSADEFMKIHAAYSTLSDPQKRADYDRRIFPIHRPRRYSGVTSASYDRFSGYSGRNWETDQCW